MSNLEGGIYFRISKDMKSELQKKLKLKKINQSKFIKEKIHNFIYEDTTLFENLVIDKIKNKSVSDLLDLTKELIDTDTKILKEDFIRFINENKQYEYKKEEITFYNYHQYIDLQYTIVEQDIDTLLHKSFLNTNTVSKIKEYPIQFFKWIEEEFNIEFSFLNNTKKLDFICEHDYSSINQSLKTLEDIFIVYKTIMYIQSNIDTLLYIKSFIEKNR